MTGRRTKRSATTPPGRRDWRRLGSATTATWVGVAVAVAMGVPAWLTWHDSSPGLASPTTPARSATSAAGANSPATHTGGAATGATPASRCVDAAGRPSRCDAAGAGVPLAITPCSVDAALSFWGLDPALDALLVTASPAGGQCALLPAPQARGAGATALDLARLPVPRVPDRLRACARGSNRDTVSCADPHTLEWIGRWRPQELPDPATECAQAARTYTDDTLAGADTPIESVAVPERQGDAAGFRCAVTIRSGQLNGSLAHLGANPLPLVR